jgi:GntR family transcriptional regulator, transcriptional repressor for pyruvate dehydrogenase complex
MDYNKDDFSSMIETRFYLELSSVRLAAERRSEQDLLEIQKAMEKFEAKVAQGGDAVKDDLDFHVTIAKASQNSVLESMISDLVPDLIRCVVENNVCGNLKADIIANEHREIFRAIENQDVDAAEKAMSAHLNELLQLSRIGFVVGQLIKRRIV